MDISVFAITSELYNSGNVTPKTKVIQQKKKEQNKYNSC